MSREISNIIKEWKQEAKIEGIILIGVYSSFSETITICTDRPGLMIGKGGELLNKYKEKLQKINPKLKTIKFVETERWYIK